MVKCIHCHKTWSGHAAQHCTVCHETFSSDTAGDRHRTGGWTSLKDPRRCLWTEAIGLVCKDQGGPVWGFKSDPEALARLRRLRTPKGALSTEEAIALG